MTDLALGLVLAALLAYLCWDAHSVRQCRQACSATRSVLVCAEVCK